VISRPHRIVLRCLLLVGTLLLAFRALQGLPSAQAQSAHPIVYVVPIEGHIDLGLAPFVERVVREAFEAKAAFVILEINTFGGRVDGAVLIRDTLLRARVPTVAFVNKRAISAGALITLAGNQIAMAEGATIGAAMPVQMGEPGGEAKATDEKTVSYVRKEFRATAEARSRPLAIAEAMVDADVEVKGLVEKGKLLTLTTEEAIESKVADFRADSLEAVLAHLQLEGAEVRRAKVNWAENIVRFLTNPILGSLLITLGILGILVEIRTPGFGVPGIVGLSCLMLFFWGHWIVQLAGWEELLLVLVGLILLAVETFVLPGFGVAGVLGIIALLGGLSLSMIGAGAELQAVMGALMRSLLSLVAAVAGAFLVFRWVPRSWLARGIVLDTALGTTAAAVGAAPVQVPAPVAEGQPGVTITMLRPAGIAEINGLRVDVVAEGEYIPAGTAIRVHRVEGHRVVVHRVLA
jgi:membrane-bound serine protease (ClpP class)